MSHLAIELHELKIGKSTNDTDRPPHGSGSVEVSNYEERKVSDGSEEALPRLRS